MLSTRVVGVDVACNEAAICWNPVRRCGNVPKQKSAGQTWREELWCTNSLNGRRDLPSWYTFKTLPGAQDIRRTSLETHVLSCTTSPTAADTRDHHSHEDLPSMSDIVTAAQEKGVKVELKSFGPTFSVQAFNLAGADLGRAQGFILPWFQGSILHLDWIRLTKVSARNRTSVLGVGVLMGAVAVRHGLDCSCTRAELLAINDSPDYHAKLVRYYTRMGFKPVYEVTGGRLQDIPHMLVWGGVGTRMDADVRSLLQKWASSLRPATAVTSNRP